MKSEDCSVEDTLQNHSGKQNNREAMLVSNRTVMSKCVSTYAF